MNLSYKILIGLFAGCLFGLFIAQSESQWLNGLPAIIAPIGSLWINAIRMTIIPLLMSLIIVAIGGTEQSHQVLAIGGRSLCMFAGLILLSSSFSVLFAAPLISGLTLSSESAELMHSFVRQAESRDALPPFSNWLINLVPANPFSAAANGEILPLMVFTGIFALALMKIDPRSQKQLVEFFAAVRDALFVVVSWVMALSPYGIFALVLPVAANLGTESVVLLGSFIFLTCSLIVLLSGTLYLILGLLGYDVWRFARTMAPVQVIGLGTRSSLAALPATLAASRDLAVDQNTAGLVLPTAVTLFKFASPLARTCGAYFIAALYGIELALPETIAIALAIGVLSFYSPGIPSGGLLVITPVFVALDLPVEGIGLLIAVDLIIDMFITGANIAANMAATLIIERFNSGSNNDVTE